MFKTRKSSDALPPRCDCVSAADRSAGGGQDRPAAGFFARLWQWIHRTTAPAGEAPRELSPLPGRPFFLSLDAAPPSLWQSPTFKELAATIFQEAGKLQAMLLSLGPALPPNDRARIDRICWHFQEAAALMAGKFGDPVSGVALEFCQNLWPQLKAAQGSETRATHYLMAAAGFAVRMGLTLEELALEAQEQDAVRRQQT